MAYEQVNVLLFAQPIYYDWVYNIFDVSKEYGKDNWKSEAND